MTEETVRDQMLLRLARLRMYVGVLEAEAPTRSVELLAQMRRDLESLEVLVTQIGDQVIVVPGPRNGDETPAPSKT